MAAILPHRIRVALVGNPNSGKSSLFNILTGLRQSVSNFPGVTVDKKVGTGILDNGAKIELVDLPGLYSLHPNSSDEKIVVEVLTDQANDAYPDLIVYVADVTNLERHLLLATQINDLQIPMIFALNMIDALDQERDTLDIGALETTLSVPVIPISGRESTNIEALKYQIQRFHEGEREAFFSRKLIYDLPDELDQLTSDIAAILPVSNSYHAKIYAHHSRWLAHLSEEQRAAIADLVDSHGFDDIKHQLDETMTRYDRFGSTARQTVSRSLRSASSVTQRIDDVITHRILGPFIFFALMLLMFQAIYAWSAYPMDLIDQLFAWASTTVRGLLPAGWVTDLIVEGVISGLGGIMIFIPQITILFLFISILEETGYMSRAVFMFDGIMQRFGLNGRSIVALVSSGACAIPAIMSTRTISSWKERLNTILVAPLISCSARIPVYAVLIGFVVPPGQVLGVFNKQGLAFMGLYIFGIIGSLLSAFVFKKMLKVEESNSFLMMELPQYKPPIWQNAFYNVKEKVVTFIVEAGKVIMLISIILWFLSSYGPTKAMNDATTEATATIAAQGLSGPEADDVLASRKIEASYAGHIGKFIEPVIRPLGFDWKIGIALITSFAAREVFVGTMSTIYAVGSADDDGSVISKMSAELRPDGTRVYNPATALSLLIFYVFAMQCMSTLAVVYRETKSWKWPTIQFFYMGALAYLGSLLAYQLMS